MGSHKYSNKLIDETSPYLLQHAHNPVNWYPWGHEALEKARNENKPILVSIGYSACHWCHVMEKESFENEETAAIMNQHFVNIKIDREERPDLDHIYMDAVQAISGSGGWPLNVFLTPDGKPFYGGTYFPPQRAFNRPSWREVLANVNKAFLESRHEIDAQAENLTEHLRRSNDFQLKKEETNVFDKSTIDQVFYAIMKQADKDWGGFGRAPKFPQTFTIQFLLRYHYLTRNEEALQQALLSLDKMVEGGIYDQVGGGFARYSTDTEWLVPHFEKMLYDNALLLIVLSEAYQLTKKERYREVMAETIKFLQREMLDKSGGFYSALDADSEGVEGKFYVWSKAEAELILGKDADIVCEYFDITAKGNWHEVGVPEGKSIPRILMSIEKFSQKKKMDPKTIHEIIDQGKKKLLAARSKKIRPGLDDKIILGWNALMNIACSKAFAATGVEEYKQLAIDNMQFLWRELKKAGNEFHHTWKNNQVKYPAFLDDYAFLISALMNLQEITGDRSWLTRAEELNVFVIDQFSEEESFMFYYTSVGQKDVILRKKELYDGAVPSGNSTMAFTLYHLSILLDRQDWKNHSLHMVSSLGPLITKYPTSFGVWACLLQEIVYGTMEIALTGAEFMPLLKELLNQYLPNRVLMASDRHEQSFPLLAGKPITDPPSIWFCRDYSCQRPVNQVSELIALINRGENRELILN